MGDNLSWLSPVTGVGSVALGFGNLIQNQNIANKNFQLQQEQLEYQKALQQEIFDREDTAYQRTVNDMRSAGLSPLSMSGTNGAGSVVSTSAPQRQGQDATNAINSLNNVINQFATASTTIANVKNAQKQNELLQTEINANNIDNAYRQIEKIYALKNLGRDIGLKDKELANYDSLIESQLSEALSRTNLNKAQTKGTENKNSLFDIEKSILELQKDNLNIDRDSKLSAYARQKFDDDYVQRHGLADSMPANLKNILLAMSNEDYYLDSKPENRKQREANNTMIRNWLRFVFTSDLDENNTLGLASEILSKHAKVREGWYE